MKRNKFSLSSYKLFSCNMGALIPCNLIEVLPGDTIQQATSLLVRCSPLIAPVYHPVHVRIHHWFVPHRIVWEDWEDFITGGQDGNDTSVLPIKTVDSTNTNIGSLFDYMGVPPVTSPKTISALPLRGYTMIFNEWYRDQDLLAELPLSKASGGDTITNTNVVPVMWEKDYFTTSRPWEQKGPSVTIPIGDVGRVRRDASVGPFFTDGTDNAQLQMISGDPKATWSSTPGATGSTTFGTTSDPYATGLEVDLTTASSVTINALREALAIQRYEEARARYGSRYVEYLRYLGVRSSDARLQRPEYLGGGRATIQFSEVLQTAPSTEPAGNVGELKGHGISSVRSNRYRRFFEEHGYVFTLVSVLPKTMYMDGLFRHWNRRTREDFWQREFEHIGQQPVLNKEVFVNHAAADGVFGFQDRYDEYRRAESSVSGEFRTTLNFWHLAREFASDPALNSSFVIANPTKRVFAEQTQNCLWIMARHNIQARRMVSKTGTSFIL